VVEDTVTPPAGSSEHLDEFAASDPNSTAGVQATCFAFRDGGGYVGCVRFKQEEFYSTRCSTYEDAMSEAQKIGRMLYEEGMITECVGCQCIPPRSKPEVKK